MSSTESLTVDGVDEGYGGRKYELASLGSFHFYHKL